MRAPAVLLLMIVANLTATVSVAATGAILPPPPNVTRLLVYAPTPDYPADAVNYHRFDTGLYLLRVQIDSGRVTQVLVGQSAGDSAFDRAAAKALIRWRFKPGAVPYRKISSVRMSPPQTEKETLAKVPVTFAYKKT